jgi:hypothetical protein
MERPTPAGRLVAAFGDVQAMAKLYAPTVEWSLSASTPFPRPIRGKDAVVAFNTQVWTDHYRPDCQVEILDEVGDARASAVRFTYRAFSNAAQRLYKNEYTVFVRSGPDGIEAVFEAFDTALTRDFFRSGGSG